MLPTVASPWKTNIFVKEIISGSMMMADFEDKMQLRMATLNDLELLNHWDSQQHIIDSDPNDDWNWETELDHHPSWREQLIAELHGEPIGFIQIINPFEEESHYWGNVEQNLRAIDIWIGEEQNVGKGYGTTMMTLALDRCFQSADVKAILVDPLASNKNAHKFYEKLGFRFIEKKTFGEDKCFVYRIDRADWLYANGRQGRL